MLMFCMDDMVPQNHMLRLIDKASDWNFIYDLVEEKYCLDNGRQHLLQSLSLFAACFLFHRDTE